jgi:hypothetical protein
MSIDISHKTEARLTDEARRQGVSVDALLERLMSERGTATQVATGNGSTPTRLHALCLTPPTILR